MIEIISIAFALLGLLMTWSLAKAAGDADKRIEEFYQTFLLGEESQDGSGSKKFSRRHKHKLSAEEKLERDLKDCMKCKYFWGNNHRCINNKCYREKKKPEIKKPVSECDGCPYNKGNGYCFPCMKKILGK